MSELGGFGIRKDGSGGGGTGLYVRVDGTTPLTADWNAGSYTITSYSFVSTSDSTINSVDIGKGGGNVSSNTSLGNNALLSNTTGANNTAVGATSLQTNITGSENTAVGSNSLLFNVADGNTAVGAYSLRLNSTGYYNTSVGRYTLKANTTGQENTAIGYNSLQSNTTGADNVGLGISSLNNNTTGSQNTALGSYVLSVSNGSNNVGVGFNSLYYNSTGSNNVGVGINSLINQTTASTNTAIGSYSLEHTITGGNNVGLGYGAGRHLGNGSTTNTTPTNSVFIGANTRSLANNNDNQIVIGYLTTGNGSNTVTIGNSSITATYLRGSLSINGAYTLPTTAPTSGQVLGYSSAGVSDWVTASGGLTKFTEAESTTTPNATVYVDSLTANGSTTNVDVAIVPKGSGAFLLAIPDGTTTGGNKRGLGAIDLQISRTNANQVATGAYSVALGRTNRIALDDGYAIGRENTVTSYYGGALGYQNSTSGSYAVCLGYGNIASGQNSTSIGYANNASAIASTGIGWVNTVSGSYSIAMGYQNTSSSTYSVAIGGSSSASNLYAVALGSSNTASGNSSIALGYRAKATGQNSICLGTYDYSDTTASGTYSVAIGIANISSSTNSTTIGSQNTSDSAYSMAYGYGANTFGITGKISKSSYNITTRGDVQDGNLRLIGRTTDATPKTLNTINTTLINSGTQLSLQNQQLMRFKGSVTGKQQTSTNVGVWDIDGVIVRGANAGTTTLVISNVNLVTNASGWGTPVLSVDTTNGCLSVQVTGLAGTNIQWQVSINTVENLYA